MNRIFIVLAFCLLTASVHAQNAQQKLDELYNRYSQIPNYSVDITYVNANDKMGFSNTQKGLLVVEGDKYKLNYGNSEVWLNDGETEYIGTKEDAHSQLMYFCPGENFEAIIDFKKMMTFYHSGHKATLSGNILSLEPTGNATPYVSAFIEFSGDDILVVQAVDDFGSSYTYKMSNFSTNTSGTQFVINPNDYREKIDEREGCN